MELSVEPVEALVDVPRRIVLRGATPGGRLRLRAQLAHPDGSRWSASALFAADAEGVVDLARAAPLPAARDAAAAEADGEGSDWQGVDATAPFWALRRRSAPLRPELSEGLAPLDVQLRAEDAAGRQASARAGLRFLDAGVVRRELRGEGPVGSLFARGDGVGLPAVLVLAGSGGGLHEQRAALYAAHGYAALALGYFKLPGRPDHISDTPLEYFETALRWLRDRLRPAGGFIAVSGVSRGGELSLLLGAQFPELVSAVVAYVPSAYVNGTLRAGRPGQRPDATAWTWQGRALPNIWQGNPQADWRAFDAPPAPGRPIRQAAAFHSVLRSPAHAAAARIPVERIRGPVLLISGSDDGFWPSTLYGELIVDTLRAQRHRWPVEHLVGEGAGHAIGLPQLPATQIVKPHPVAGLALDGGGTAAANARASARSWPRVLRFLDAALQARLAGRDGP